jgi:hypothetical protein
MASLVKKLFMARVRQRTSRKASVQDVGVLMDFHREGQRQNNGGSEQLPINPPAPVTKVRFPCQTIPGILLQRHRCEMNQKPWEFWPPTEAGCEEAPARTATLS